VIFEKRFATITGFLCLFSNSVLAAPLLYENQKKLMYGSDFNKVFVKNNESKSATGFSWDKLKSWTTELIVVSTHSSEYKINTAGIGFYDVYNKGMDEVDEISSDFVLLKSLNDKAQISKNSVTILSSIKGIRALLTIIAKMGYENRGHELLVNEYLIPKEKPRISKEEEVKIETQIMDELREESYVLYLLKALYIHIQKYVLFYAVAVAVLTTLLFFIITRRAKKKKRRRRRSSKNEKTMELKTVRRKRRRRKRRKVTTVIDNKRFREIERKKEEYLKNKPEADKAKSKNIENKLVYSFYI